MVSACSKKETRLKTSKKLMPKSIDGWFTRPDKCNTANVPAKEVMNLVCITQKSKCEMNVQKKICHGTYESMHDKRNYIKINILCWS